MIVYISEISYEPEGDVKGTFSGTLADGYGNEKVVTDGSFSLKFQN
jgi:hypothetical protein